MITIMSTLTTNMYLSIVLRIVCVVVAVISWGDATGQGYVLDPGINPVPISYQEEKGGEARVIGKVNYKVTLKNGSRVNSSVDSFSFQGQNIAQLMLEVEVEFDRPNNRKMKDLRVIFSEEAFRRMRGTSFWKLDQEKRRVNDVTLGHGDQATFHFTYPQNGTVNFNLPFVVASAKSRSDTWVLPERYSPVNHILSRQIKVTGILTDEERMWINSRGRFDGVAAYLRAYRRGYHAHEAGRFFTNYAKKDFARLVTKGTISDGPEQFIESYESYADFTLIANLLAQARSVIDGRQSASAVATTPRRRRNQSRTRTQRSKEPEVEEAEEEAVPTGDRVRCRVTTGTDGREEIELFNFENPAYYDIYGGLLEIDDSELLTKNILRVRQVKQGTVNLLIIERNQPSKFLAIPLDNIMKVNMVQDPVLGQVHFDITGGIQPYDIHLGPRDGQQSSWAMNDIEDREFNIPYWDLQIAGLEGRYQVSIFSEGSPLPHNISNDIKVPGTTHRPWLRPLLVAILIGGIAVLLLLVLSRSDRRRRRQRVRV